jgi:ATP-binding cassette subfamily C (CFTR/MRP) protein 1
MEEREEEQGRAGNVVESTDTRDYSIEDQACLWSKWTLSYLDPILSKGGDECNGNNLTAQDLGVPAAQDVTFNLQERFTANYSEHVVATPFSDRSLWRVLWKTLGFSHLSLALVLYAMYYVAQFGPIIILTRLVKHFEGIQLISTLEQWILVALMFIIPMIGSLCSARSNALMAHLGIQFKNILVDAIYQKALKLSPQSRQLTSTGQIVNMFSSDTTQVQHFLLFFNICALCPLAIAAALALIFQQVGMSMFAGLGLIAFSMPINGTIFSYLSSLHIPKMVLTDQRVKLMNELLNGIRVVKFYAWEAAFIKKVRSRPIIGDVDYLIECMTLFFSYLR